MNFAVQMKPYVYAVAAAVIIVGVVVAVIMTSGSSGGESGDNAAALAAAEERRRQETELRQQIRAKVELIETNLRNVTQARATINQWAAHIRLDRRAVQTAITNAEQAEQRAANSPSPDTAAANQALMEIRMARLIASMNGFPNAFANDVSAAEQQHVMATQTSNPPSRPTPTEPSTPSDEEVATANSRYTETQRALARATDLTSNIDSQELEQLQTIFTEVNTIVTDTTHDDAMIIEEARSISDLNRLATTNRNTSTTHRQTTQSWSESVVRSFALRANQTTAASALQRTATALYASLDTLVSDVEGLYNASLGPAEIMVGRWRLWSVSGPTMPTRPGTVYMRQGAFRSGGGQHMVVMAPDAGSDAFAKLVMVSGSQSSVVVRELFLIGNVLFGSVIGGGAIIFESPPPPTTAAQWQGLYKWQVGSRGTPLSDYLIVDDRGRGQCINSNIQFTFASNGQGFTLNGVPFTVNVNSPRNSREFVRGGMPTVYLTVVAHAQKVIDLFRTPMSGQQMTIAIDGETAEWSVGNTPITFIPFQRLVIGGTTYNFTVRDPFPFTAAKGRELVGSAQPQAVGRLLPPEKWIPNAQLASHARGPFSTPLQALTACMMDPACAAVVRVVSGASRLTTTGITNNVWYGLSQTSGPIGGSNLNGSTNAAGVGEVQLLKPPMEYYQSTSSVFAVAPIDRTFQRVAPRVAAHGRFGVDFSQNGLGENAWGIFVNQDGRISTPGTNRSGSGRIFVRLGGNEYSIPANSTIGQISPGFDYVTLTSDWRQIISHAPARLAIQGNRDSFSFQGIANSPTFQRPALAILAGTYVSATMNLGIDSSGLVTRAPGGPTRMPINGAEFTVGEIVGRISRTTRFPSGWAITQGNRLVELTVDGHPRNPTTVSQLSWDDVVIHPQ